MRDTLRIRTLSNIFLKPDENDQNGEDCRNWVYSVDLMHDSKDGEINENNGLKLSVVLDY